MTLPEFRHNKALMREAAKLRDDPTFKAMLDVLHSEHVMFKAHNSAGMAGDDKTLRLGQIEGYNLCQQTLLTMFEPPVKPRKEPEATFAEPRV